MGRENIENIRALGSGVVAAIADPDAGSRAQAAAPVGRPVQLVEDPRAQVDSGL